MPVLPVRPVRKIYAGQHVEPVREVTAPPRGREAAEANKPHDLGSRPLGDLVCRGHD